MLVRCAAGRATDRHSGGTPATRAASMSAADPKRTLELTGVLLGYSVNNQEQAGRDSCGQNSAVV